MNCQAQLSEPQIFLVQREGAEKSGLLKLQARLLPCMCKYLTQKHPCLHSTRKTSNTMIYTLTLWHADTGTSGLQRETTNILILVTVAGVWLLRSHMRMTLLITQPTTLIGPQGFGRVTWGDLADEFIHHLFCIAVHPVKILTVSLVVNFWNEEAVSLCSAVWIHVQFHLMFTHFLDWRRLKHHCFYP